MHKRYQTHADAVPGMSDSQRKLRAIHLPSSLAGTRVLDIGCNEGFFCNEAIQRGAATVTGIDVLMSNIDCARKLMRPRIRFIHQSWAQLPAGEFDLILWMSTMHYERNPRMVLDQIRDRLAKDGLFIFEGGVVDGDASTATICISLC